MAITIWSVQNSTGDVVVDTTTELEALRVRDRLNRLYPDGPSDGILTHHVIEEKFEDSKDGVEHISLWPYMHPIT